jgi:hypothetical protein
VTFAMTFAAFVLAYQPALRDRLFVVYAAGADTEYAAALPIFTDLKRLCAEDTGVVLASADDGSPIVFHSQCGVIANNFILRPNDKAHIDEVDRLMRLSPEEIRRQRPDVKYVFVRARDFSIRHGDASQLAPNSAIARELFLDAAPPAGFTLVRTIQTPIDSNAPSEVYARLYKVTPEPGTGTLSGDQG